MDDLTALVNEAKHSTLSLVGMALSANKEQFNGIMMLMMKWVDCTDAAMANDEKLAVDLGIMTIEPIKLFIGAALADMRKLCATKLSEEESTQVLEIQRLGEIEADDVYKSDLSPIEKKNAMIAIYGDMTTKFSKLTGVNIPSLRPYGGPND